MKELGEIIESLEKIVQIERNTTSGNINIIVVIALAVMMLSHIAFGHFVHLVEVIIKGVLACFKRYPRTYGQYFEHATDHSLLKHAFFLVGAFVLCVFTLLYVDGSAKSPNRQTPNVVRVRP